MGATYGAPPTVLVVDDLEKNAQILESFLRPRGYNPVCVNSGEAALRHVESEPPDVILLDLMMPDPDGFEVCRRLKEDVKTHHVPIIIVTGLANRDANILARDVHRDCHRGSRRGLTHPASQPDTRQPEIAGGPRRGFLIRLRWTADQNSTYFTPYTSEPARLGFAMGSPDLL